MTAVDAELSKAREELEALGYAISHDLGAPVRAIAGFAGILLESYAGALDDDGKRFLAIVRSESEKMGEMVEGAALYCRLSAQTVRAVPCDMESLARASAQRQSEGAVAGGLDLRIGPLPQVVGDPDMLAQVWDRLIGNAIKYSGGRTDAAIEISGTTVDGEAVYSVADNGAGFDMEFAGRLFALYRRLHRADEFPGVGVGLAIVRCVVARHGGRVWTNATVGEGATFSFALPVEGA
jgi:light-regulated signal transduction histidine kinase (bacteriophytochrome)